MGKYAHCQEMVRCGQSRVRWNSNRQWCLLHKSTWHSKTECRMQCRNKTKLKIGNCSAPSCKPTDLSTSDIHQGDDLERLYVLFIEMKVASDEDAYGPYPQKKQSRSPDTCPPETILWTTMGFSEIIVTSPLKRLIGWTLRLREGSSRDGGW